MDDPLASFSSPQTPSFGTVRRLSVDCYFDRPQKGAPLRIHDGDRPPAPRHPEAIARSEAKKRAASLAHDTLNYIPPRPPLSPTDFMFNPIIYCMAHDEREHEKQAKAHAARSVGNMIPTQSSCAACGCASRRMNEETIAGAMPPTPPNTPPERFASRQKSALYATPSKHFWRASQMTNIENITDVPIGNSVLRRKPVPGQQRLSNKPLPPTPASQAQSPRSISTPTTPAQCYSPNRASYVRDSTDWNPTETQPTSPPALQHQFESSNATPTETRHNSLAPPWTPAYARQASPRDIKVREELDMEKWQPVPRGNVCMGQHISPYCKNCRPPERTLTEKVYAMAQVKSAVGRWKKFQESKLYKFVIHHLNRFEEKLGEKLEERKQRKAAQRTKSPHPIPPTYDDDLSRATRNERHMDLE